MKRILFALLAAIAVIVSPVLGAKLPDNVGSIMGLTLVPDGPTVCTVWQVDQDKGLLMTDGHCVLPEQYQEEEESKHVPPNTFGQQPRWNMPDNPKEPVRYVQGKKVTILKRDSWAEHYPALDLALLLADVHERALKLGDYPQFGDEAIAYGFPMGWGPFLSVGHVAIPFARGAYPRYWQYNMFFDMNSHRGQSGAPILDRKGHVISMVQGNVLTDRGDEGITLGVAWTSLKNFIQ